MLPGVFQAQKKDGTVYFANPDDDYKLYSMDSNGNNLKKLSDDIYKH